MKNFINIIKLIIAILIALLIVWVLYLKSIASVVKETEASTEVIHELYINETKSVIVEPTVEPTTETIIVKPTVEETSFVQIITDKEWNEANPINISYNTSIKSNLTEEEIEYILDGTYLEGTGWAFKYIEDTYNVNAIFALSVAETETTFGKYGVAESHNNAFGLTSPSGGFMYFDSLADSVLYFGAYIPRVHWNNNRYYIGDIAPVYCDYEWGEKVEDSLQHWYEVAYQVRNVR